MSCSETDISSTCIEPPGGEFDLQKMNLTARRATSALMETVFDLDSAIYPISEDTINYDISSIVYLDDNQEYPAPNGEDPIRYYSDFVQLDPDLEFPGIRFMIEDRSYSFLPGDLLGTFPDDLPDYDGRCNDTIDITG